MFDRVLKTALQWKYFSDYHSQIDIRKDKKIAASLLESFKIDWQNLASFEKHYGFLCIMHFGNLEMQFFCQITVNCISHY